MIIDLIIDRKDGQPYNPKDFYNRVMQYEGPTSYPIATALDSGENTDIIRVLSEYIINNEYNTDIISYIESVQWI